MVLQKSLDDSQLGLEDVIEAIFKVTFGNTENDAYLQGIQYQVNANVLKYLMNLATNNESYFQTKAIASKAIFDLSKKNLKLDAINMQYGVMIKEFYEHPEKFKIEASPKIPDGSPIGSDVCNYNPN